MNAGPEVGRLRGDFAFFGLVGNGRDVFAISIAQPPRLVNAASRSERRHSPLMRSLLPVALAVRGLRAASLPTLRAWSDAAEKKIHHGACG